MRRSDNQRRRFCAMLLGPPEEIALCALSTHYAPAAASFNLGICTSLPRNAYSLTELLLHRIVFFCHTHLTHRCSTLIDCAFTSYPTMQLPSTSWSCNISQSTLRDMFCCFRQNRLSLCTAQSITTSTVLALSLSSWWGKPTKKENSLFPDVSSLKHREAAHCNALYGGLNGD